MFGNNDSQTPVPPALPPALPATPQFATAAARPVQRGKPFGGTLLTSPLAPAPAAQTARKSLVGS